MQSSLLFALEQRQEAFSIERFPFRQRQADRLTDGGKKVQRDGRLVDLLSLVQHGGPADHERHADSSLVGRLLVVPQLSVIGKDLLASPVIGIEKQQGIVLEVMLFQFIQYDSHGKVHPLEHAKIDIPVRVLILKLGHVFRWRLQWPVNGVKRQVEEEGFFLVTLDKRRRLAAEVIGQVAGIIDPLPVAPDRVMVIVLLEFEVIVRPVPQETIELVKAPAEGMIGFLQAQVPLAKNAGHISRLLEVLGNRDLASRQPNARIPAAIETEPLLVSSGHQAGP